MPQLRDLFPREGQEVNPLIKEVALVKNLIKERLHPLDLLRELLSNAGSREVGATEIRLSYYVNQHGHVFEIADNGCGMDYTGETGIPGRLDRFLGLGLSAIVGMKSDEFSWKGLGSKLAYQSQQVQIETYPAREKEVYKVEINDPWGTITKNNIPKPRIYRFPPSEGQQPGTKITIVGHPPHRREEPFTMEEIKSFLVHRTFAGFTCPREVTPRIFLTVMGTEKELAFGFPELAVAKRDDETRIVDETKEGTVPGTNVRIQVRMKGFYTWEAEKYDLSTDNYNTGLILSVKGIPYLDLDMEEYGSNSLRTANPGMKKCCLIVECDQIQEEMNISRSGLVDSAMTDLLKKLVGEIFRRIESSQDYLTFRKAPIKRKTRASAKALDEKKRRLESTEQRWVIHCNDDGHAVLLGREPENENDALAILWKMEAYGVLPFAKFVTLAHAGDGPDLIIHFQEDRESQPDRYTVVEAERFFVNYDLHGHAPSQYPRVVCWDIGRKRIEVNNTTRLWKKTAKVGEHLVHIFCLRHMPGIDVVGKAKAEELKLL
ncbi:MAG: hypothetical protein NTW87_11555 [Planctomycetota bacterium]|nr:hypothetical protein [Planctomycetota bacterium]